MTHLRRRTVLQIGRGKRDNLGIISHNTPLKHMLRPIMRGRNICFRREIRKNIFELSSIPLLSRALRGSTGFLSPLIHEADAFYRVS